MDVMSHLDLRWSVFRSGFVVTPPPPKIDGSHICLHWEKFQVPQIPSVDWVVSQLQSMILDPETCKRFSWFSTIATVLKGKINIDAVTMKNSPSTKETNLGNSGVCLLVCIFFIIIISLLFPIYCFFLNWLFNCYLFFCPQRKERKRWAIVVLSLLKFRNTGS